jgi:protein-S-isoprenylcysteine O-methyltransferase Ste14
MRSRAALVCMILIAIVDGFLAFLAVLFSEMVFGEHEGLHGETSVVAMWAVSLALCVVAPMAGFVLWAKRKSGIGISIAVLPIIAEMLLLAI